jgi:hypothetical protein
MIKKTYVFLMLMCFIATSTVCFAQSPLRFVKPVAKAQQSGEVVQATPKAPAIYSKLSNTKKELLFPEIYKQEIIENNPVLKEHIEQLQKGHKLSPFIAKADDDVDDVLCNPDGYKFIGFNAYAGGKDSYGYGIAGMVDFNVKPLSCDTVAASNNFSSDCFYANGKFYAFTTVYNQDYSIAGMDCVTYNPLTWAMLDSTRVSLPSGSEEPFLSCYDSDNGMAYCITLDDSQGYDMYYLNLLDLKTFKLKHLAYLGGYSGSGKTVKKTVLTPKSLICADGKLYMLDGAHYLYTVDATTGNLTKVATFDIPHVEDEYGNQGLCFVKSEEGDPYFVMDFYSLWTGTIFYKINLEGGPDYDQLEVDSISNPDTGYHWFCEKPSEKDVNSDRVKTISDLTSTVKGSDVTVDFTVPSETEKGVKLTASDVTSISVFAYVDGTWTAIDPAVQRVSQLGQHINTTISGLSDGRHIVSISCSMQFSNEDAAYIQPQNASNVVFIGADAPASVTNAKLVINDKKAKITWDAPTQGVNGDFGATFDPSLLTYDVVRVFDHKTVAKGITTTEFTDEDISDEMHQYSYEIIPYCNSLQGEGVVTNAIPYGSYAGIPYLEPFDSASGLDFYTILSPDNSGRPWFWSSVIDAPYCRFNMNSAKNEWLITPSFHLDNSHVYLFSYDYQGGKLNKYFERMKVTMGQGNTVEAQNTTLATYDSLCAVEPINAKHYINVKEAGNYNFGFYNYSLPRQFYVAVDNVSVKEYTTVDAPAASNDLTAKAADKGELKATLSFTVPSKSVKGDALSSITKVEIMSGDKVIQTLTNASAGSKQNITVDTKQGYNTFDVVAYNDKGIGVPASVKVFTGVDVAKAVKNFKLVWGSDNNTVNMTWSAPTSEGKHGGYVNTSDITYNLYTFNSSKYDYVVLKKGITGTSLSYQDVDLTSGQDYKSYYIAAANAVGESDYTSRGINLGNPYDLTFEETFKGGMTTGPWITGPFVGNCSWVGDPGVFDLSVAVPEGTGGYLMLRDNYQNPAGAQINAPMINLGNAENPRFSILAYHSKSAAEGSYVKVVVSTNGTDFDENVDSIPINGQGGWQKHVVDLSKYKGKKVLVGIKGYMADNATRIFVTDIKADNASGNDLALTGFSTVGTPKIGENQKVEVAVANLGTKVASDYTVDLYNGDGTVVDEYMSDAALNPSNTKNIEFNVPVTAANAQGLILYAKVDYEGDENLDNNTSSEVEVTPLTTLLPVPENLKATASSSEKADLSWDKPQINAGLNVNEGFENVRAFTINDFDGWTTYDGDKENTISFQMSTDGNDWPNLTAQMAWEVWNPAMAGTTDALLPLSGNNALVSFKSSGFYPGLKRAPGVNDDWLISPELLGGSKLTFNALAIYNSDTSIGTSNLQILYSAGSKDIADFKPITSYELGKKADDGWENISVDVPADAKYIAIRNIGTGFGIMLDDMNYTLASTPVLKGYNVYRNSDMLKSDVTGTTYSADAPKGEYKFGVSAIYDLGESEMSNISIVSTGVATLVENGITVTPQHQSVRIQGAYGKNIVIYSANGTQEARICCASNDETVALPMGVYVLKIESNTHKLIIK